MRRDVSLQVLLEGWVSGLPDVRVNGLCTAAEKVEAGNAWVDVLGTGDARLAAERGAEVLIRPAGGTAVSASAPVVGVGRLAERFPELAARFWRHPAEQLDLFAVAGNEAGSSVAHFIEQSWRRQAPEEPVGTVRITRSGNGHVDPLYLQEKLFHCVEAGAKRAVVEAPPEWPGSSTAPGLAVQVAVFCGDGKSGGSCFSPMFADCRPRFAVIDHDCAEGKTLSRLAGEGVQVLTFGTGGSAELSGHWLGMDSDGMTVRISSPWGGGQLRTGLLGRRSLSQLLAAAGALALGGMPWNRVMHQLEIMSAYPGTLYRVGGGPGRPTAVIDYADTPKRLEDALVALRSHLHGRLCCVLTFDSTADERMVRVARSLSDRVMISSIENQPQHLDQAAKAFGPGDIVLVAGRPGEHDGASGLFRLRELMGAAA